MCNNLACFLLCPIYLLCMCSLWSLHVQHECNLLHHAMCFGHNESSCVLFAAACSVIEHKNACVAHREWGVWRRNAVVSSLSPHTTLKHQHLSQTCNLALTDLQCYNFSLPCMGSSVLEFEAQPCDWTKHGSSILCAVCLQT